MSDQFDKLFILQRLTRPEGKIDLILDTDTYNEIDDQYCVAYALLSPEKINLKGIYAELFCNDKVGTYKEGMEKSYAEIHKVIGLMGRGDFAPHVFRGSDHPLTDEITPVPSDAAADLVRQGMAAEGPLYVAAIGALSNVASALLMEPKLKEKIILIWLGNNSKAWPHNREFNYMQDPTAARVVFNSGVPVINIPAMGVTSHMTTSEPELRHYLKGKNSLCDYLYEITCKEAQAAGYGPVWAKEIWDIVTVGWILGDDTWTSDYIISAPVLSDEHVLAYPDGRHPMRQVYQINRNKIFKDIFDKLTALKI